MRQVYWAAAGVVLVGVSLGLMLPAFHGGQEFNFPQRISLDDPVNEFAIDLYKELARRPGNILVSPYIVAYSLALAWAGARDETAWQIYSALRKFCTKPEEVHPHTYGFVLPLRRRKGTEFYWGNGAWLRSDYQVSPDYLKRIERIYRYDRAELRQVDFRSKDTAQAINRWCEQETRYKITNLVAEGDLAGEAPLVLTSAVYFADFWQFPFDKLATVTAPFQVSDSKQVKVPMMHQSKFFRYLAKEKQFQMVAVPYQYGWPSLYIFLPEQGQTLAWLEEQLSAQRLKNWVSSAKEAYVQLALPRFEVRCRLQLQEELVRLGMRDAFSPDRADFRGISSDGRLYLGRVLHQAWLVSAKPALWPPQQRSERQEPTQQKSRSCSPLIGRSFSSS